MHNLGLIVLVALLLVAGALSAIAAKFKPRGGSLDKPWPLEAKRQLLTERERAL